MWMACRMWAQSSTPGRHTTARLTAPQVCSEGFLALVLLRCYLGCRAFECGMALCLGHDDYVGDKFSTTYPDTL